MLQSLQEILPNISQQQLWKLILTLKCRYKTFGKVGISRYEAVRFGLSARQMRNFIDTLRDFGILELSGKTKASNGFLCNVYKIGKEFLQEFLNVTKQVKNVFEYIDPVAFVKANFKYKTKWGKITFKHNGNKYNLLRSGRFKDKIYGITEDRIINPYILTK